jgi:hypothetical protein
MYASGPVDNLRTTVWIIHMCKRLKLVVMYVYQQLGVERSSSMAVEDKLQSVLHCPALLMIFYGIPVDSNTS